MTRLRGRDGTIGVWLLGLVVIGCGEPASGPPVTADGSPIDAPAQALNVVEQDEPGADWACADRATCIADYLAFPSKVASIHHRPISQAELDDQLTKLWLRQVPVETIEPATLAPTIRDRLNIEFLIDGIDQRELVVVTSATRDTADYRERTLIFRDPLVGTFKGLLLVPNTPGPHPAIIAIHGHPDDAELYRDGNHGGEWPGQGYAILMLTMRAMAIDNSENEAWHALIREGFSLVGLRVYETLLGHKYLRYLAAKPDPQINEQRLGLIGHSGGSSASNLTVRIEPRLGAYVSDNQVDWFISGLEPYHCETVPALFPYHQLINDFATSATPILEVPYGYANGMSEIFAFMNSHLAR